jgi:hypothetical protein
MRDVTPEALHVGGGQPQGGGGGWEGGGEGTGGAVGWWGRWEQELTPYVCRLHEVPHATWVRAASCQLV